MDLSNFSYSHIYWIFLLPLIGSGAAHQVEVQIHTISLYTISQQEHVLHGMVAVTI